MVERLLAGHGRFQAEYAATEREFLIGLASAGQRPAALFIGCSDSRVIPELLTGAAPGDLFVVRNVANQVPIQGATDSSVGAAIEFAVDQLRVRDVIVCGHDECGGVTAAVDGLPGIQPNTALATWLSGLLPAAARARASGADHAGQVRRAVEDNVLDGIANLLTYSSLAPGSRSEPVRLHGWVYSLRETALRVYDARRDGFVGLADAIGAT